MVWRLLVATQQFAEAEQMLSSLPKRTPHSEFVLAHARLSQGDLQGARDALEIALTKGAKKATWRPEAEQLEHALSL